MIGVCSNNMKRKLIASIILNCLLIIGFVFVLVHYSVAAKPVEKVQENAVSETAILKSTYYMIKNDIFENTADSTDEIVFLGDSITDIGDWENDFPDKNIVNQGINGDTTYGVLNRIDNLVRLKPRKVFIMIGINDIAKGLDTEKLLVNYNNILSEIKSGSPDTEIYVQSILPINQKMADKYYTLKDGNKIISDINDKLEKIAADQNVTYLDLYPEFLNSGADLDSSYTLDGLHLNEKGYQLWVNEISNLVE